MPTRVLDPEAALERTEEGVTATYKQITEKELEDSIGTKKSVNMVQENGETLQDEAEEKMLSPNPGAEVKFISGDQTNGDAKVDVECLQQVFTGMGKDELMKYAKDPFWVRLRWTLFVLFWLLWTAMLVGAIVIVVAAPKCAAPQPKTWWEEGPLVDIDLPTSGDDNTQLLTSLKEVGAKAVVVHVPDSYDLYKDNYTYSDIKEFVEKAKAQDLHVILDVQANFVPIGNKMFVSANENQDSEFSDYFIWSNGKASDAPNNWKAIVNGSAWTSSPKRGQYYLSQFGSQNPDLNFDNVNVQNMFTESLENLMKTGISGIKLRYAKYLLVDQTFKDEAISSVPGFVHTDYGFYNHIRTSNQPGLGELLKPWKETVHNNTEDGVFYIAEDLDRNTFMVDGIVVPQLPSLSKELRILNSDLSQVKAKDLAEAFKNVHTDASNWPHIQYSSEHPSERLIHNMLVMLLPGVPELTSQQLLGQNMSLVDQTKVLLNARQNPSVKFGTFQVHLLANETVFGYSRLKPGNPGLIVLYNAADTTVNADLTNFLKNVPTVTVVLLSENYQEESVAVKSALPSSSVPISSKSAMLVSYVPSND